LASAAGKQEYNDHVVRDGRGLTEVLQEFRSATPPLGALLELVPKLTPRYYTISSSPAADAASCHLTVKVLREPMRNAPRRLKVGVCSTQLETLTAGCRAVVFVRPSAFRLPADMATPLVMVGPGTGVAPFRALLQEMGAAAVSRTGRTLLYFGCRYAKKDYIYESELAAALKQGTLTTLRLAFSRDAKDKVYVQHLMRKDARQLWPLIHTEGAHVYVCGGTSMGRAVVSTLQEMAAQQGRMSDEAAAAFIKRLTAQGRLVQELWS